MNGLRAVHCCVMWLGVNGTETVHYGIRVWVKCPQDIEQLRFIPTRKKGIKKATVKYCTRGRGLEQAFVEIKTATPLSVAVVFTIWKMCSAKHPFKAQYHIIYWIFRHSHKLRLLSQV